MSATRGCDVVLAPQPSNARKIHSVIAMRTKQYRPRLALLNINPNTSYEPVDTAFGSTHDKTIVTTQYLWMSVGAQAKREELTTASERVVHCPTY